MASLDPYIVYALIDPRNYKTRYIGITTDGYNRFVQHLGKRGENHRKNGWIQELEDAHEMIAVEVIDKAPALAEALSKEAFWINHYQAQKVPLLNRTLPKSVLKDATDDTPAQMQVFFSIKPVRIWNSSFVLHSIYVDALQGNTLYYVKEMVSVSGCVVHESIDMASCHFYIKSNDAYEYMVRELAKHSFQVHEQVVGYRFKLEDAEWATFGDKEIIQECDNTHGQWIKHGFGQYEGSTVTVPCYDESGELLYSKHQSELVK